MRCNTLNCGNHWIISQGTNASLFNSGTFPKSSTIQILRQKMTKKSPNRQQTFSGTFLMFLTTEAAKDSWRFVSMLASKRFSLWKENLKRIDVKKDIIGLLQKGAQNILNRNFGGEKGRMSSFINPMLLFPITSASSSLALPLVMMKRYRICSWKTISLFPKFFF